MIWQMVAKYGLPLQISIYREISSSIEQNLTKISVVITSMGSACSRVRVLKMLDLMTFWSFKSQIVPSQVVKYSL